MGVMVLCGIGVAVSGQWLARYDTPGIGVLGGWDWMCKGRLPLVDFSFLRLFFAVYDEAFSVCCQRPMTTMITLRHTTKIMYI
jgi:hypothetical protein